MTNSKYSNEAELDDLITGIFVTVDMYGTNTEAREDIKELVEQIRTNTIDAAIAALPEKITNCSNDCRYGKKCRQVITQNNTIDQAKSNILKLKKGSV